MSSALFSKWFTYSACIYSALPLAASLADFVYTVWSGLAQLSALGYTSPYIHTSALFSSPQSLSVRYSIHPYTLSMETFPNNKYYHPTLINL